MRVANPKAVGGFVIGALILALLAVVVFGSGTLFKERLRVVAFFPGSHIGLRVGAPVEIRGIQIGTVTDIWVQIESARGAFNIPVVMDIEVDAVRGAKDPAISLEALIERGLRVRLAAQSLVTGQQSVQADFLPETPVVLIDTDLPYPQVPALPSAMDQFESSADSVIRAATEVLTKTNTLFSDDNQARVADILDGIARLTNQLELALGDLRVIMADAGEAVAYIEGNKAGFGRLLDTTNETLLAYKSLANHAEALIVANRGNVEKSFAGLQRAERKIAAFTDKTTQLLEENRAGIRTFANDGLYEIKNLAVDGQAAVEQFRRVMEEMERDPALFFLGKPGQVEIK